MLIAAVLILALADTAPRSKSPTPPYSALTSSTESARYALTHGCLAAARQGVKLADAPNHFIRLVDKKRGVYRMTGAGHIELSDTPPQVGCYTRVIHGKAEALRSMALELLAAEGPVRPVFDSGPGSRDSIGSFRQESHCVRIAGRPWAVLISTSEERRRPAMQLSLIPGDGKICAP
jgi:hypothetical protein